jgi:hypothetical protein
VPLAVVDHRLVQVENYDVSVSRNAKFVAVSSWHHEARVWHPTCKAGSFESVTKAMTLSGHAVCVVPRSRDGSHGGPLTCL